MIPRPYQQEALDALHRDICERDGNPCIVIPTGGGKSAIIAWTIKRWKETYPEFRCIVLAHRKELIEQNSEEMREIYEQAEIGIYSAALNRRDVDSPILFASIDSVFRRSGEFTPWDVIIVDEAHRIPFSGEGKYRRFITECKKINPKLRVIGFTATPFRMAGGDICHKDHILTFISYEAEVQDLINDGFLCKLRSKVGETQPNLNGVKKSGGDYNIGHVSKRASSVIDKAVVEAIQIIVKEDRKSVIFFCVDVDHCTKVSEALARMNFRAPIVTAKTPAEERDKIARQFKEGKIPGVCNVNVFTEGFNVKCVDCIVLLRPTLSPGLYSQMVGRGLRSLLGKLDCLVLDFAGCITEHGPIDCLGGLPTVMATCSECRESFSRAIGTCPACGREIPKREIARIEAAESKKRMHGDKASKSPILSTPETHVVHAIFIARHKKEGKPDSLRVSYRCGMSMFTEWVCLDHEGYARDKAREWRSKRFGDRDRVVKKQFSGEPTVNEILGDMFFPQRLKEWTKTITVIREGRGRFKIIDYNRPVEAAV